jgi:hypothetical protein
LVGSSWNRTLRGKRRRASGGGRAAGLSNNPVTVFARARIANGENRLNVQTCWRAIL